MDDLITVVSGMPRAGTSLVMAMLGAGGMDLLTDGRRTRDEHNPLGYFEYEPVKRLASDSSWVPLSSGKAVKVIYRLLEYLPPGCDYRVLFVERDLREIFASQRDMLRARGDAAALQDEATMLAALADELARVWSLMAGRSDIRVMEVPYAGLLRDALGWAGRIAEFLNVELDTAAMAAAVDRALYRHRANG